MFPNVPIGLSLPFIHDKAREAQLSNKAISNPLLIQALAESMGKPSESQEMVQMAAPASALLLPFLSRGDPAQTRALYNIASIAAAAPSLQDLLTKAIKAREVYKSLPPNVQKVYLQKMMPEMMSYLGNAILPILVLQASKHMLPEEKKETKK